MTPRNKFPQELSDEQLLLQIAESGDPAFRAQALLKIAQLRGLVSSPADSAPIATAPVTRKAGGRRAKRPVGEKFFHMSKVCVHCGKTKNVGRDFGTVMQRGIEMPNGWCNQCRSSTNYHGKPRKYRTKNNP